MASSRKRKSSGKPSAKAPKEVVQQALQLTWQLKGQLKFIQIAYLRAGAMLVRARDEKMYEVLGHKDMEEYAQKRLELGRSSLYRYLRVYDWVTRRHPEWLQPKVKGTIPPLDDTENLIWIEDELAKPNLDPERKMALEDLQDKALHGRLLQAEFEKFRRSGRSGDSLKAFLSRLRSLRKQGARLKSLPAEALAELDALIALIDKAVDAARAQKAGPRSKK